MLNEELSTVPVIESARVHIRNVWTIESVIDVGFREELFTSEANCPHDANHVASHWNNLFEHLLRNDVLVSALRRSIQEFDLWRLGCESKSSKRVDYQVDPQKLNSL